MNGSEKRLVDDASRGDAAAVTTLLERHLDGLEGYLRRRAGPVVSAKESSADLVQSVCREVLERLEDKRFEYRGEAAFRDWLYRAAELKLMHRMRYYRAPLRDAARETALKSEPGAATEDGPSTVLSRREDVERLRNALEQLPEDHARIVELSRLEGLGHREIAEQCGITESHSRVLLSRALARLATIIAGPNGD